MRNSCQDRSSRHDYWVVYRFKQQVRASCPVSNTRLVVSAMLLGLFQQIQRWRNTCDGTQWSRSTFSQQQFMIDNSIFSREWTYRVSLRKNMVQFYGFEFFLFFFSTFCILSNITSVPLKTGVTFCRDTYKLLSVIAIAVSLTCHFHKRGFVSLDESTL